MDCSARAILAADGRLAGRTAPTPTILRLKTTRSVITEKIFLFNLDSLLDISPANLLIRNLINRATRLLKVIDSLDAID